MSTEQTRYANSRTRASTRVMVDGCCIRGRRAEVIFGRAERAELCLVVRTVAPLPSPYETEDISTAFPEALEFAVGCCGRQAHRVPVMPQRWCARIRGRQEPCRPGLYRQMDVADSRPAAGSFIVCRRGDGDPPRGGLSPALDTGLDRPKGSKICDVSAMRKRSKRGRRPRSTALTQASPPVGWSVRDTVSGGSSRRSLPTIYARPCVRSSGFDRKSCRLCSEHSLASRAALARSPPPLAVLERVLKALQSCAKMSVGWNAVRSVKSGREREQAPILLRQ